MITILLMNSDNASASALDSEYKAVNITSYAYTSSITTTIIMTWSALQDMISHNTRLVTFVASLSPSSNTVASYLLDEFTFVFVRRYKPVEFYVYPGQAPECAGKYTNGYNI